MKLPSKYIALLVILSLAGIFGYQAYWLTGLYRTMRTDLERNITEAMRISTTLPRAASRLPLQSLRQQ